MIQAVYENILRFELEHPETSRDMSNKQLENQLEAWNGERGWSEMVSEGGLNLWGSEAGNDEGGRPEMVREGGLNLWGSEAKNGEGARPEMVR